MARAATLKRQAEQMEMHVLRYQRDPVAWVREIARMEPEPEQVAMLNGLVKRKHVVARSGHGIGKTTGCAMGIWWFETCFPFSRVPCTSNTESQLRNCLFFELHNIYNRLPDYYRHDYAMTTERLYNVRYPEQWYAVARTASKERPEALQGFHAKEELGQHLMYVIDEASGIPNAVFHAAEGSLTDESNLCLMIGNPTRRSGFFFDAFHKFRQYWHCLHFNSEKSRLVSKAYIERMLMYGRNSNIYRVRVLGEFPAAEADQFIALELVESAMERKSVYPGGVRIWGVDVAERGDCETVCAMRHGDTILPLQVTSGKDTVEVVEWVLYLLRRQDRPQYICVDAIGYGAGVASLLQRHLSGTEIQVIGVNTARKPVATEQGVQYANLRAQLWGTCKDELIAGTITLPQDDLLAAQLTTMKHEINSRGEIQMQKKRELKKSDMSTDEEESISPDRADAVVMTFYSGLAHILTPEESYRLNHGYNSDAQIEREERDYSPLGWLTSRR